MVVVSSDSHDHSTITWLFSDSRALHSLSRSRLVPFPPQTMIVEVNAIWEIAMIRPPVHERLPMFAGSLGAE